MRIKVEVWEDSMGCIHGQPVREDLRDSIKHHLLQMGFIDPSSDFFIQGESDCETFLNDLRPEVRNMIKRGWNQVVIMDAWSMAHYYGWDAHTIFE